MPLATANPVMVPAVMPERKKHLNTASLGLGYAVAGLATAGEVSQAVRFLVGGEVVKRLNVVNVQVAPVGFPALFARHAAVYALLVAPQRKPPGLGPPRPAFTGVGELRLPALPKRMPGTRHRRADLGLSYRVLSVPPDVTIVRAGLS